MTEKEAFPDAGTELTQIHSTHLSFELYNCTCGKIIPPALKLEGGLVNNPVLLFIM